MILKNKATKILDFDHLQKLHPSEICTYAVCMLLHLIMFSIFK